jgi:hypothetical protein
MKLKLAVAIATLCAGGIGVAQAQAADEDRGAYVGGGVGQFNVEIDDYDDVEGTVDNWESDDTAYKVFAGYRFSKYIAAQVDYINLGSPSAQVVPGTRIEAEVDGFRPSFVATLPLGDWFEVFGHVGYYFYDASFHVESDVFGDTEFDEDGEELTYGVGVGLNFLDRFNVRFEYDKLELDGVDDANSLWLTAAVKF